MIARFFVIVLAVLLVAPSAHAFCRKTTAGDDASYDPTTTGRCAGGDDPSALPLYWRKSCVAYRVVVDPELEAQGKMTTARATAIVEHATSTWSSTKCGERPLAIRTANAAVEACPDDPGTVRSAIRFAAAPAEPGLLATTHLTFDSSNGSISVAELVVPDVYRELDDRRVEAVVRHELGHFLGLAHSQDRRSVMYAGYDPNRTDSLTGDDVDGICDAYDPARPIGAGCSFSPEPAHAPWVFGLVLVVLRLRRRSLFAFAFLAVFLQASIAEAAKKTPKKKNAAPPKISAEDNALLHRVEPSLGASTALVAYAAPDPTLAAPPPVVEPDAPAPPAAPVVPTTPTEIYIGERYRAFVLPSALAHVVAQTNEGLLFHSGGIELELRKKSFSIVPAITFADLSTRGLLVGDSKSDLASSFSYLKSYLFAVASSVGLQWSFPLSRAVSFELGVELGAAVTFGSLHDNWVYETPNGPLALGDRRFAPCRTVNDGFGCRPQDHASGSPVRVGDYEEKSMFSGGKAPTILPWVSLPLVGVRTRISDGMAARVGIGASFTGVWAGVAFDQALVRSR